MMNTRKKEKKKKKITQTEIYTFQTSRMREDARNIIRTLIISNDESDENARRATDETKKQNCTEF